MRRRDFIAGLGGAILARPFTARAQQPGMPVVGFLGAGAAGERAQMVDWFTGGLKEGGFVVGKNVAIEYRWGEGSQDRLSKLAADLVARKVSAIATSGGPTAALAAKSATSTIPIVFISAADPVKLGLVASLSRPGGNATGVTGMTSLLDVKRLELLRELVPTAKRVVYLVNPEEPAAANAVKEMVAAAERTGAKLSVVNARNGAEIDAAFAGLGKLGANALVAATDALFTTRRNQIVALAARHSMPASYSRREYVVAGGLMSYGPDYADVYRTSGRYVARILKGEKPANLPVVQETRFNLVVNAKTAKKLGLRISPDVMARVDEVIE